MNILIPMGGRGLRFKNSGMSIPKPLIDVDGEPMISRVIDSIKIDGKFTYIVRKDHVENYRIDEIITNKQQGSIRILEEDNEGQTQTCLLAEDIIDNNEPLFIINCDNYFIWEEKTLQNLLEKKPISNVALAGGFYWKRGSDFVKYAKQIIENNIRAENGEFYLGSVFNAAIQDGKNIINHKIEDMKCLGTPEELSDFTKWLNQNITQRLIEKEEKMKNRNVQDAIEALQAGKPIVLVDEHDRENEGDIVIAAEKANVDNLVFTMNNARGLMCVPCDGTILDRLQIPQMVQENTDKNETPFTVSVDSADDECTTGMSVYDRLNTISKFVNPSSKPAELNRPGHLFPLRPKPGLLQERRGHTEGSIELMKLAGLQPVSIIVEIMNDNGTMAKGGQINKFATENGLTLISIEELYETIYGESI